MPTPTASDVAITEASIEALLAASTRRLCAEVIVAPVILALVFDVTALTADAPAPETPAATMPPAKATEAAEDVAVIVVRLARRLPEISSIVQWRPA